MPAPARPRLRLFVALDLPADVREDLVDALSPLRARWQDLKWVRPEGMHVTLAFLGSVDEAALPHVVEALQAAGVRGAPVQARLDGTGGSFGGRVLWARLVDAEPLADLAGLVRGALSSRGIAFDDGPFRPHVTLARVRRGARLPREAAASYAGPAVAWTVERVVLYRSQLRRGGAIYTEVAAAPLG